MCASAQEGAVLLSASPDVFIDVTKSNVGPDYVRIKMRRADYPKDLLKKQIDDLGHYTGSQARGLDIFEASLGQKIGGVLTANFAMDGIIDRNTGTFELNAFARAFAGAPEAHRIKVLAIAFDKERPKAGTSVGSWTGEGAAVTSAYDPTANVVEYRIALKTQDPDQINIPKTVQEQTNRPQTASKEQTRSLVPWVVAAAVIAGVLVYFALRPGRRAAPPSTPE
jgi:hypothetical protein